MIKKLFNPFTYIAGERSLIAGIAVILATGVIGFFSHMHFPNILSVKTSPDFPLQYYLMQNIVNWLVISTILYLISILFSKSSVRIVDVFGTQGLARFPYLISAFIGFSASLEKFGEYVLWELLNQGEPVELSTLAMVIAIFLITLTLLLTIWLIILSYNAFKVSSNIKGPKSVWLFILGLLLSIFITEFITNQMIQIL